MSVASLDDFYEHSDLYETLDACQALEMLLGRLRRQQTLTDLEWMQTRQSLADIRARLESRLAPAG